MIEEVRLPEISENVDSGEVIEVLVKNGDHIEKEQSVAELETEKAAFEVPSPVKGRVTEVNISQGDKVKVGQTLIKVDTEAEAEQKPPQQPREEPEQQQSGRGPTGGPAGAKAEEPQPTAGGSQAPQQPAPGAEAGFEAEEPPAKGEGSEPVPAAPSVRQLARELGVDIHRVPGTAEAGRISAEDVKAYARRVIAGRALPAAPGPVEARPLPDFEKWGSIERRGITATRRKIAETLSYTWSSVPQVTQYDRADITALEESRKARGKDEHGKSKLTITAIALKVAALALREYPKFNASFDPQANQIIYKKYIHISVAVETDRGLLVPVLRDADKKSIPQLSYELAELAQKARKHKISPDEMVGGNFTVSNLGGIGGTNFAPIIYWPQMAILGLARAVLRPCCRNGRVEPRLILPLSLSYDHRIIDGAEGLFFIRWIADRLENPLFLALEGAG